MDIYAQDGVTVASGMTLVKRFFEDGKHGRKVELAELKALTMDDKAELVTLVKEELGIA